MISSVSSLTSFHHSPNHTRYYCLYYFVHLFFWRFSLVFFISFLFRFLSLWWLNFSFRLNRGFFFFIEGVLGSGRVLCFCNRTCGLSNNPNGTWSLLSNLNGTFSLSNHPKGASGRLNHSNGTCSHFIINSDGTCSRIQSDRTLSTSGYRLRSSSEFLHALHTLHACHWCRLVNTLRWSLARGVN